MNTYGYPNLHTYGWAIGVHRAPEGYQHPWIAVGKFSTCGAWTRAEARTLRNQQRNEEQS